MQAAKFTVEKGAAKAEVTVSIFPNSTGGTLGPPAGLLARAWELR